jgi:hypothetical protein
MLSLFIVSLSGVQCSTCSKTLRLEDPTPARTEEKIFQRRLLRKSRVGGLCFVSVQVSGDILGSMPFCRSAIHLLEYQYLVKSELTEQIDISQDKAPAREMVSLDK